MSAPHPAMDDEMIHAHSNVGATVSEWRCLCPSNAMNRAEGWKAKLLHVSSIMNFLDPVVQDYIMPADVVIFQRNVVNEQSIAAMQYFRGMGKVCCIDLDDAYHMLPWSNPAHSFWIENSAKLDPKPLEMLERGLSLSNGLIAPNKLLLSDWSHVTRGYYLPNFARTEWWTDLPERESLKADRGLSGRIVVGWGGSVSHYDSWWGSGIREAAERVTGRHPELVWMICGNDSRIYDQLNVSVMNKMAQPGVLPHDWPKIVKHFDIGVAPLYGIYDRRRSSIKFMEYALAGVPCIGSDGETYNDTAGFGTLVHDTVDQWEYALESKIANLKQEQEAAQARIPLAQQCFFVDRNLHVFQAVFSQIKGDAQAYTSGLPGIHYVGPGATQLNGFSPVAPPKREELEAPGAMG